MFVHSILDRQMILTRIIFSILILVFLVSCMIPQETIDLPEIQTTAPVYPDVAPTVDAFMNAWHDYDYASMYKMLTLVSQSAISEENFINHYDGVAREMMLSGLTWKIHSLLVDDGKAQVVNEVTLQSGLVGDLTRDIELNLSIENGQWRIQWDDTLVLPELGGSNYLLMDRENYLPSRANIYDLYGHALVAQTDAVAVGLFPDQILPDQEELLLAELESITGISSQRIRDLYSQFPANTGRYVPIAEVPADQVAEHIDVLSGLAGLVLNPYRARYYFDNGAAPHVIGYMGPIDQEDLALFESKGYSRDERVGKSGIEKWGEEYLAGKRGGALYVFNGQGEPVTRLLETEASPGQAIYTTIDRDFQIGVQQAIAGFRGAIVVMERDTGRILAMVSSPSFDPNAFEPVNFNSESLQATLTSSDQPLLNRATQGVYPLGSVFKTIVMAAALESGWYSPESTYQCGYKFEDLGPDSVLYDWTYEYFQLDKVTKPSGNLTLSQGLMRSCNPWFYHIALEFFRNGEKTIISDMAGEFGLGKPSGIEGIDEAFGNVPQPVEEYDATNLGIGQGDLLVTPLQVANFMAAIGNGGTLLRPQIIEAIVPPDGPLTFQFKPETVSKLNISSDTLTAVQDALVGVVRNIKPEGTAWHQFTGLDINVAGKTGTATSGYGEPHAWFAGYTFENRPDKPDIAIAVILENAGEGSAFAAPVFRRVVELYYSGQPQKLYEWESTYGVTRTPEP